MIKPRFRKAFLVFGIGILVLFVGVQFIPSSFSRTNPPVNGEPPWDSPATRETFFRACADCHSNESRFPWYSGIAPVSWLIEKDIREGRRHFNVSEWNQSERGGEDAVKEVSRGAMPMGPYLLMHPESNLNIAEKRAFVEGLRRTFGSITNEEDD
ncbi:MAG: heme-binding domain-containing protein [Bacteroidota bacterium]